MDLISSAGEKLLDFLELRQVLSSYDGVPQGPALEASGKVSPHASCSGASRDSSPVDAGAYDLVWSQCRNLRIPLQCPHGSSGTSGVPPGASDLGSSVGMHVRFPPDL